MASARRTRNDGIMTRVSALAILYAVIAVPASAQPYQARRDGDIVRLEDTRHQVVVSILPRHGHLRFAHSDIK